MIVLDTHVLVWTAAEPRRLSAAATKAIRKALSSGGIGIASVTLWELAMLFSKGRLRARGTVETSIRELIDATAVSILELTPSVVAISTQLPESFPRDPVDRIIAATALAEGLPLVTSDSKIRASGAAKTIW